MNEINEEIALLMVREQANVVYRTNKASKEWVHELNKLDRMASELRHAGVDAYEVEHVIIDAWAYKG